MANPLQSFVKESLGRLSVDTFQRPMAYAILANEFAALKTVPAFTEREKLWRDCVASATRNAKLTYIEFGVHKGYSINYFAQQNVNPDSMFFGLDSFEGLPEDWAQMQKGAFDTKGAAPQSNDPRIGFIKGWFQDTWDTLAAKLSAVETLVVHYDADLYSSTLFALTKIDSLRIPYTAIFDEFTGHETRALFNYIQAYGAAVKFLGRTDYGGYPNQVVCRIVPRRATMVGASA